MPRQLHSWLLIPLVLGIALTGRAGAQSTSENSTPPEKRSVSHLDLELPDGITNPEEFINGRLQGALKQYDVQKITELIKSNPQLQTQLMEMLERSQQQGQLPKDLPKLIDGPFDPQSGRLPEKLQKMLPQIIEQADIKLPATGNQGPSKDDIKQIGEKLVEQLKRSQETGAPTQFDPSSMMRPGAPGSMMPPGQGPQPPVPPGSNAPDSHANPFSGRESGPRDETSRELVDFLSRRLSKLDSSSPSMEFARRSLERFKIDGDSRFLKLNQGTDKVKSAVPDWVRSIRLDSIRPERGWPLERGLPDVSLPQVRLSGNWFPSAPRVNLGVAGAGAAGTGTVLLYLVAIAVAGFVLWKAMRLGKVFGTVGAAESWKLGPWPVNPAAVRTREEMVKAFEYLSLLLLGPGARHRNHLEIAADLSGDKRHASVDRHVAAQHLAALYERARYAPPNESLPETELPAARRYLCYLAGVSHA
jgi:hypothetical protein